jgi:oligopeptide/dipeptide ABC transporter ATP-binding protein
VAEALLDVRNITKRFATDDGGIVAVDDVSFSVAPGEFVSIIGPSGCGKSTLFNIIGGLTGDYTGQVSVEGGLVSGTHPAIGMVFQEESTFPWRTVLENVAFPLEIAGVDKAQRMMRAAHFVELVGLSGFERRLPEELSGGMRQRVAIAIAIALNPSVLIADEPTTALDVTTQAQVLALLDRLVEEHRTAVILITHNLGIVSEFCDSVAVMYAGRFVETSGVEHIFRQPTHPYSEALLKCVPNPERLAQGPLPAITGFPPDLSSLPIGCAFAPRCPIGRELPQCHGESPLPHEVSGQAGEATVECHFADSRISEVSV